MPSLLVLYSHPYPLLACFGAVPCGEVRQGWCRVCNVPSVHHSCQPRGVLVPPCLPGDVTAYHDVRTMVCIATHRMQRVEPTLLALWPGGS